MIPSAALQPLTNSGTPSSSGRRTGPSRDIMDHSFLKPSKCTLLVTLYLLLTITTLVSWKISDRFAVTGDEPHLLVMTSGIIRHHTLEQTAAYRDEFRTRQIVATGLAPADAIPRSDNTHAVQGPHGLYNIHNIGLPVLMIPAYGIGRTAGVKIFLILLSSIAVIVCWKTTTLFTENEGVRFLAVAGVTFGLPLLPAANQIYPDLVGGEIALAAGYWILTARTPRPLWVKVLWAIAIAYMPWLMIKYAATTVVMIAAISWLTWECEKKLITIAAITLPTIISLLLLGIYNQYAYGKFIGPVQVGALQMDFSRRSLVFVLGIHLDQNQGLFLQNPIFLVGLLFFGWLWKTNWKVGLALVVAYLSLVVPNGLNVNRYGGWSFCGRYCWAGALLFTIPTMFGLVRIAEHSKSLFRFMVVANLCLQAYFYYLYTCTDFSFYSNLRVWADSYSIFYRDIYQWLPALYDPAWAYDYLPNVLFSVFTIGLLLLGIASAAKGSYLRRGLTAFLVLAGSAIVVGGFVDRVPFPPMLFAASELPSQTGHLLSDGTRIATGGADSAAFVTYGPHINLHDGEYRFQISYASHAPHNRAVGAWDVFRTRAGQQIRRGELRGTNGRIHTLSIPFELVRNGVGAYEFRTFWYGSDDIQVVELELDHQ